jgi:fibronectin-binding autotransporter adhesin
MSVPAYSRRIPLACLLGVAALLLGRLAPAADVIKADNADALNATTSWTGGVVPTAADVGVWDNTVTAANSTNLGGNLSWQGIRIADPAGAVTINNSAATTLTLGSSGIDMSAATQNLTFGANAGIVVDTNQTWNIARGRTLTLNRATTGSGDIELTASGGSGLAVVSWAPSTAYAGQLTIGENVEVSRVASGAWLGTQTVRLDGGRVALAPNASVGWSNAFEIEPGTTTSAIVNHATSTGAVRSIALNGVISGGGTGSVLTFRNNGFMPFNGLTESKGFIITRDSTFQGTIQVEDATGNATWGSFLRIGADRNNDTDGRNYGSGGNNGSLNANAVIDVVNTRSVLLLMRNDAYTFANTISGLGELWVGTSSNTSTNSQVVTLSGNNSYSGSTIISAGTLRVGDNGTTGTLGGGNVVNNASVVLNRSDDIAIANVISGTGTLTKAAAGTVSLTGTNTYTGATTVSTGTLALGNGGTTGSLNDASAIDIAAGATLHWNRSNSDTGFGNVISGSGTFLKSGAGEIGLTGTTTFSGLIDIQAGKFGLTSATSVNGAPSVNLAATGTLSLGTGFSGGTATIGNLSGSGTVDTAFGGSNDTRTLSVNQSSDTTFSGTLADASSSRLLALTKTGSAKLTLDASGSYTFTGATSVNAGTLLVNGSLANTSGVSVASAATLGGSGSIGGPTSILAGGILSPGTSPGTLTITNTLSLAGTSILDFEIDAADPSSSRASSSGRATAPSVGSPSSNSITRAIASASPSAASTRRPRRRPRFAGSSGRR